MSSFYLTLPSNSSMDTFPANTLTQYVTKLPDRFDLIGEWEVGLSEIQYPISWYNVGKEESRLYVGQLSKDSKGLPYKLEEYEASPPPGHYENPEALVRKLNAVIMSLEKKKDLVRFVYNDTCEKITINFTSDIMLTASLLMTRSFAELLGFHLTEQELLPDPNDDETEEDNSDGSKVWRKWGEKFVKLTIEDKRSVTAPNVCDLQRVFYSLFVYCDVVEHVVVGDVKAPLLRTVNIAGKEGFTVNRIFQTVQYVPVQRKQFSTIEIDIRDDTGRPVPFQRGKVIVTLHFRRKRPAYF